MPPTSNVPPVQPTQLTPTDEAKYRLWMRAIGHTKEAGMNVTPEFTGTDYDYRGFFSKYGTPDLQKGQHLTDEFKLPNHPTFSTESLYATGPYKASAGSWNGDLFEPPATAPRINPTVGVKRS